MTGHWVGTPAPRGAREARGSREEVASKVRGARTDTSCSLHPRAGVTTCVFLSWASSQASGGPSPSSAGSVTGPSVSCCHPSTFPTCTACGEPRSWWGGWSPGRVYTRCHPVLPAGGTSVHGGQSRPWVPPLLR